MNGRLRLYNTRTRSLEQFAPLNGNRVRIYVCGLTPSSQAHLGHARSFLFFDVLRRYLVHTGYDVTYVQNVTDIDDRSIATARARGIGYRDVVDEHYAAFKAAMKKLDVREPDAEPYATAFIPQIQTMIRELVDRGHAYAVEDGIYYAVATFPAYGALSRRNVDELEAGARIERGEHKKDPLDFALWKYAKPGEPSWPFEPFGAGRPGWHIECSAMARELLDPGGVGFDVHGGGADLIFPHHENEIAQSEPLMTRPPMANVWAHGGLLLFDSRKMSKSLGNFEPLNALLERHEPQAVRLLFLQTGYRKVMNFTEDAIDAASAVLGRLRSAYRLLRSDIDADADTTRQGHPLLERVEAALDDDMNTAVALSLLLDFAREAPRYDDKAARSQALRAYETVLRILGIEPKPEWLETTRVARFASDFVSRLEESLGATLDGATPEEAIKRVMGMRTRARSERNWRESDRLRDALATLGVALHDTKEGTTWSVTG